MMKSRNFSFIDRAMVVAGMVALMVGLFSATGYAGFTDTPTAWTNFEDPNGYTIPYTYNGQPVRDHEGSSDPTNGGSAVSPSNIDLASGSPNGDNPGPYDTPSYGYYDGGTPYDPDDPTTMEDDYVLFTMRLVGDPRSAKEDFDSYHWNILLDADNDGYKEYWVDLDGGYTQKDGVNEYYDRIQILYDNDNSQEIADPDAARVDEFRAYSDNNAQYWDDYSHTRVREATDGTGDYWIDIQVPMTAFKDLDGNQVLFPNSPVGFVFSTSSSNTNPLQKDFMSDLDFLTTNDPINFGDIVKSNGEPDLFFADSELGEVDFYTQGDNVYLYLRDPRANLDDESVETVTATVSDPITGDDETVTLTESGPNTGIFSNLGGASTPESSDLSNGWIPFVQTSIITANEEWTVTYNSGTGTWDVVGSVSGAQGTATAETEFTSSNGAITFTIYEDSPANGDTVTFSTYQGDPLTSSGSGGTDDDGDLQVASGHTISYSYTNGDSQTFTDTAQIVGPGEPFIQFTRSEGLPSTDFELTTNPATSDLLYVTVYHFDSNTNPSAVETIQVTLSGLDSQTLTLTETGPNTGIFRNTTGLQTKVSDGTVTGGDNLWEDLDQGEVTATFTYGGYDYTATTSLFYVEDGGRVYFMNGAGTIDVEQYAADQPVFIKVTDGDSTSCITLPLTVTVTNGTTGDSETVTLYETAAGSNVYMNRINDLVTTAGSAVVTSGSSSFQTDGVLGGDTFVIATGPDAGVYTVSSVDSQTQITLTDTLTADRTGIGFTAQPLMTATDDGSATADNGVMESQDGEILTVTYDDCNDGDGDSSNDLKTDEATYNAPPIVINEVLFYPEDPAVGSPTYEYVQLYNASSGAVNVTGYTVTDGDDFSCDIPQYMGSDISLAAGQKLYVVLVETTGTPLPDYDSANGIYYVYAPVSSSNELSEPGDGDPADQILLYDDFASEHVVDYVSWSTTSSNSIDFRSDDEDAVAAQVWQDNDYRDVATPAIAQGQAVQRCSQGVDTDTPGDWCYAAETLDEGFIITLAVVSSFDAYEDQGQVVVEWETASEIGTVGFYLYRKDRSTRGYVQLNDDLLPALLDAQQGGTYRFVDETASSGQTYQYVLVEVEATGKKRRYGPFTVTVGEQDGAGVNVASRGRTRRISESLPKGYAPQKRRQRGRWFGEENQGPLIARAERPGFRSLDMSEVSNRYSRRAHQVSDHESLRRENSKRASSIARTAEATAAGTAIKIAASENGLYYIDASEISDLLGLRLRTVRQLIKRKGFSLSNQAEEVAYFPADGDGGIYFCGEGIDSIYTNENIYWLSLGRGLEMEKVRAVGPGPVSGGETFTRTVHAEEDRFAATALFSDPQEDYWLWDYIIAGGDLKSFSVQTDGVSYDWPTARLVVYLKGMTDTDSDPDHHVVVSVNGTEVGEDYWDGTTAHELVLSFDSTLLYDGENAVEVYGVSDTGAPYSIFGVDSFDLTYQSYYHAVDNKLMFRGGGNPVVTVFGFGSSNIMVLETTDPKRPRRIESKTIEWTGGGYSVSIEPASSETPYLAVAIDAGLSDSRVWADTPSALADNDNAFDYLVIAPAALKNGAQALADYRGYGHHATVVNLEDIMDEFNHGIYSPLAIRDFLSYAYKYWSLPPMYVVLVGDGTYDYKDAQGHGDNLVPPLMVSTPYGLFASDNQFVDVEGDDGVPEMAIGRLPVLTEEELQVVLDKIIAYEGNGGDWTRQALMLADNPDGDGNFPSDSDDVGGMLARMGYAPENIYLSELPVGEARQRVLGGIDTGVGIVNYIGHAGLDRLADEGLLLTSDVGSLTNGDRLPIVTAMTCIVGRFAIPGYDSLSEALLLANGGGSVAVWAPSGMSINSQAKILDMEFFGAAPAGENTVLGDAILAALEGYSLHGRERFMLDIYNLLGDPGLRMY